MSVINQMLQDLERRHAGPEDRQSLPDEVRSLPAARGNRSGFRAAGWVVAISGAVVVAWFAADAQRGQTAMTANPPVAPTVVASAAALSDRPAVTDAPSQVAVAPAVAAAVESGLAPREQALVPPVAMAGMSTELSTPATASAPTAIPVRVDAGSLPLVERKGTTSAPAPAPAQARALEQRAELRTDQRTSLRTDARAETRDATRVNDPVPASVARVVPALGATPGAAAPSPVVIAAFGASALAAVPGTMTASAAPSLAPSVSTPSSATPPLEAGRPSTRPADTSPARIDRQEREPSARDRAETLYRRGVEAMHGGRAAQAEQLLREALSVSAVHEAARQTLLGLLVEQRRNADAESLLVEGQRQNPAQLGFAMALARLQVERADVDSALDTLQRSVGAGRDRPEFLAFQASLLARAGRQREAAQQYQAALRLSPQTGLWWMGLGVSLEADRRPGEAAEAFQRARDSNSLNAELTAFVDQRMRGLQGR